MSFSTWQEGGGCTLLHTQVLDEWVDCRGVGTVPCLRVTVNLTTSNQRAFLHFDEESVLTPQVGISEERPCEASETSGFGSVRQRELTSDLL